MVILRFLLFVLITISAHVFIGLRWFWRRILLPTVKLITWAFVAALMAAAIFLVIVLLLRVLAWGVPQAIDLGERGVSWAINIAQEEGEPTPSTPPREAARPTATSTQATAACRGSDKFNLAAPDTITMPRKGYMIVDFYKSGEPQYVTVLPFEEGTVYDLEGSLLGAYWIYPDSCSFEELVAEAIAHAVALRSHGYNVVGYTPWEDSGVFSRK